MATTRWGILGSISGQSVLCFQGLNNLFWWCAHCSVNFRAVCCVKNVCSLCVQRTRTSIYCEHNKFISRTRGVPTTFCAFWNRSVRRTAPCWHRIVKGETGLSVLRVTKWFCSCVKMPKDGVGWTVSLVDKALWIWSWIRTGARANVESSQCNKNTALARQFRLQCDKLRGMISFIFPLLLGWCTFSQKPFAFCPGVVVGPHMNSLLSVDPVNLSFLSSLLKLKKHWREFRRIKEWLAS